MAKNLNQSLKEFIEKSKDIAYTATFVPGVVRDAVGGAIKTIIKAPGKFIDKQIEKEVEFRRKGVKPYIDYYKSLKNKQ